MLVFKEMELKGGRGNGRFVEEFCIRVVEFKWLGSCDGREEFLGEFYF